MNSRNSKKEQVMLEWLKRWLKSEAGYIGVFSPDRDEDGSGGDVDISGIEGDPGEGDDGFEDPRDGGITDDGGDGEGGGDQKPPELTQEQVLDYLKKQGIEFDDLDKIKNLGQNVAGLTKQQQSAKDAMNALRAALGQDQYDALLAQGMRKIAGGGEDNEYGYDVEEPAHFRNMKPEVKETMSKTYDYFFQNSMKTAIPAIIKGVMRAVEDREFDKAEQDLEKSNPEYTTYKDAIASYRQKHGITSRSRETTEWLLKQVKDEAQAAINELATNEEGPGTKRKLGTPPPKSSARGGKPKTELKTDADFAAEYERMKKAEAQKR